MVVDVASRHGIKVWWVLFMHAQPPSWPVANVADFRTVECFQQSTIGTIERGAQGYAVGTYSPIAESFQANETRTLTVPGLTKSDVVFLKVKRAPMEIGAQPERLPHKNQ